MLKEVAEEDAFVEGVDIKFVIHDARACVSWLAPRFLSIEETNIFFSG